MRPEEIGLRVISAKDSLHDLVGELTMRATMAKWPPDQRSVFHDIQLVKELLNTLQLADVFSDCFEQLCLLENELKPQIEESNLRAEHGVL